MSSDTIDNTQFEDTQNILLSAANKVSDMLHNMADLQIKKEKYSTAIQSISISYGYFIKISKLLDCLITTHFQLKRSIVPRVLFFMKLNSSKKKMYHQKLEQFNSLIAEIQLKFPELSLKTLESSRPLSPGYVRYVEQQSEIITKHKSDIQPILAENLSNVQIAIANLEDALKLAKSNLEDCKHQVLKKNMNLADETRACTQHMTLQQKSDFEYVMAKYKDRLKWCVDITQIIEIIEQLIEENSSQITAIDDKIIALNKSIDIIQTLSKAGEVMRKFDRESGDFI